MPTPRAADLDFLSDLAADALARESAELGPVCAGCGHPCHVSIADVQGDRYCAANCLGLEVAFHVRLRRVSVEAAAIAYTRKLVETGAVVREVA